MPAQRLSTGDTRLVHMLMVLEQFDGQEHAVAAARFPQPLQLRGGAEARSTRSSRRLGSEVAARSHAEFGEDVLEVGLDG